jgi:hypothetical protein
MLEKSLKATITIECDKKPQILPKHIVDAIKIKRKIRNDYQKFRDDSFKLQLKAISKIVKDEITSYKQLKWQKICNEYQSDHLTTTKLWKTIRSLNNNESNNKKEINLDCTAPNETSANLFAENLAKTFNLNTNDFNPDEDAINFNLPEYNYLQNNVDLITIDDLNKMIKKLKKKSAPGNDGITYNHIINSPSNIRKMILDIFNQSLVSNEIPSEWKLSKIIMIRKPNKPDKEIGSYRPISLTSCLSKCLEKIVLNRLNNFLEKEKIISKYLSGFRKNHCTKDHLLRLTQHIINNFNQNKLTSVVLFDMEKAFDRVWHQGLIYKLHLYNIPPYLLAWLSNFITNRKFYVECNNQKSNIYDIKAGVPQGCILSPTLFSIYFSDISDKIQSPHAIYADDLSIWESETKLKHIESRLQNSINNIDEFCNKWCLKINSKKTS